MKLRLLFGVALAAMFVLLFAEAALAAPPSNDGRANPRALSVPQTLNGTTVDATIETGEPDSDCNINSVQGSVWYSISGVNRRVALTLDAAGDLDAAIDVYERKRSQTTSVDCQITDKTGLALVSFDAKAGTDYLIRVAQRNESVAGSFKLSLAGAAAEAHGPGKRLPAGGGASTVNWASNPSDAWSVHMKAGTTYRINLDSKTDDACVSATLFARGDFGGDALRHVSCNNGYTVFTPSHGESGRYSFEVEAENRTLGNQRYHLQVSKANEDDLSPGKFWHGTSIGGSLNAHGDDAVDIYNWDLKKSADVSLHIHSKAPFKILLFKPSGKHLIKGGRDVSKRLGPGTYLVMVRAAGHAGSYRLTRLERTITSTHATFNGQSEATASPGQSIAIAGTVTPAVGGRVEITLERYDSIYGWQFVREIDGNTSSGRLTSSFVAPTIGTWRIKAVFKGTHTADASTSQFAHVRVTR